MSTGPSGTGPPGTGPGDRRTSAASAGAEVMLAGATGVAVVGCARLFEGAGPLAPLLIVAVLAHLSTAVARRRGLSALPSVGVALGGGVLVITFILYPHTSFAGLPTATTLGTIGDDVGRALELFGEVVAPARPARGFLLALAAVVWTGAWLADWAAFRIGVLVEALLPAGSLFVFVAILGEGGGGVVAAASFAVAALAFVAVRRAGPGTDRTWVDGRSDAGAASLARAGAVGAVVVALVAGAVAPQIPGADAESLVEWRGKSRSGSRVTVSPLVDIRSRLVEQSTRVAFEVTARQPAYWRLTSLDQFDGQVWSSSADFGDADGMLSGPLATRGSTRLEQRFRIISLGVIWAPAAYAPINLSRATGRLRWNAESSTLIVPTDVRDVDKASYTVVSALPNIREIDLDRPAGPVPEPLRSSLTLPDDLPPRVGDLARVITAGSVGPYRQARALQDYFRTFRYDLDNTSSGHDESAIEAFLDRRAGYCEQFAGTFAAMARTLGIPARVAVGFTPGDTSPEDPRRFVVRGRNAHAWPEVWLEGAGWVSFEPTPGRGQPGTEDYTGVAADQDGGETGSTTTDPVPETTAPSADFPRPEAGDQLEAGSAPTTAPPSGSGAGIVDRIRGAAVVALVGLGVIAVADLAGIAVIRLLRRRRRHRDRSPAGRIRAAWADTLDAATAAGTAPRLSETDEEFAARAAPAVGPASDDLHRLAQLTSVASWSAGGADEATAAEAATLAGRVGAVIRSRRGWIDRLRAGVDPRQLTAARQF